MPLTPEQRAIIERNRRRAQAKLRDKEYMRKMLIERKYRDYVRSPQMQEFFGMWRNTARKVWLLKREMKDQKGWFPDSSLLTLRKKVFELYEYARSLERDGTRLKSHTKYYPDYFNGVYMLAQAESYRHAGDVIKQQYNDKLRKMKEDGGNWEAYEYDYMY